jgi:type II secretory ATPase GspE/PulE/Tfp pilus assembly ATPase PilB-like protein
LLNYCLFSAVNERASAVHFEPSAEFLRIRFRIDGALVEKLRLPAKLHTRFLAHLKSLCGLDASTPRPQEAHLNVQVDHKQFELILSVAPMIGGEKIVIRILDAEKASMRLEQLGFSYDMLKQWRRLLSLSSGLIVVTGPRDSGTQTTLYCSAAYKSSPGSNVCIVEPSVGRVVPGVNQFQAPAGVSVSSALEAVLKQDPDVLMLPELPDPATALLASRAAMNGQLVLAGLPAHDPISAIAHLGHLGIEPYVLSATLRGVLSQRLVRKLCHACREQHAPTQNEKRQLDKWAASFATLYRAKGCDRCHHRGHTGRVGVFELLLPTDLLLDRLGQSTSAADLRAVPRTASPTLLQDATEKLRAGVTTLDEILRIMA